MREAPRLKHTPISDPVSRHQAIAASERYITLAEAGDILGCHPRTVRRLVSSGVISGHRLGTRLLRVKLSEVEKQAMHTIPTVDGAA